MLQGSLVRWAALCFLLPLESNPPLWFLRPQHSRPRPLLRPAQVRETRLSIYQSHQWVWLTQSSSPFRDDTGLRRPRPRRSSALSGPVGWFHVCRLRVSMKIRGLVCVWLRPQVSHSLVCSTGPLRTRGRGGCSSSGPTARGRCFLCNHAASRLISAAFQLVLSFKHVSL